MSSGRVPLRKGQFKLSPDMTGSRETEEVGSFQREQEGALEV